MFFLVCLCCMWLELSSVTTLNRKKWDADIRLFCTFFFFFNCSFSSWACVSFAFISKLLAEIFVQWQLNYGPLYSLKNLCISFLNNRKDTGGEVGGMSKIAWSLFHFLWYKCQLSLKYEIISLSCLLLG